MKIALIGYGKMGKTIEKIAIGRNHEISAVIDLENQKDISNLSRANTDVIIEFTSPASAFENICTGLRSGAPVISGSTGWLHRYDEATALCRDLNGTFFYASNYSLGVNIFFKLNEWLGKTMSGYQEYKPDIEEIHHTEKKDKPSGTAITLAEGLVSNHKGYNKWVPEFTDDDAVGIRSLREPNVPGTHTITYNSELDQIGISHTAHTRDGFALGAVTVAEWIQGKKGVLSMDDFLKI